MANAMVSGSTTMVRISARSNAINRLYSTVQPQQGVNLLLRSSLNRVLKGQ